MAERYLHEAQHQKDVSVATSLRTQLQLAQLFWARCEQTTAKHVLKSLIKRCQQVWLRGGVWGVGDSSGWDSNVRSHFPMLICTGAPSGSCTPALGSLSCHRNYPSWKVILTWDSLRRRLRSRHMKGIKRMLLIRKKFSHFVNMQMLGVVLFTKLQNNS